MKRQAPESDSVLPPWPTEPGSYLLVDGEWALESVTQSLENDAFRLHETPVADGQTGDDVRDQLQSNGDGSDSSKGPEADGP